MDTMDGKPVNYVSYESLDRFKSDLFNQLKELKDDVDKRFDKLFSCYEKLKSDVAKLETHTDYTKIKFDEIKEVAEKESSLVWRDIGEQNEYLLSVFNTEIAKLEELLNKYKKETSDSITTNCKSSQQLSEANSTQAIQKVQIKFWLSVAMGSISLLTTILLYIFQKGLGPR